MFNKKCLTQALWLFANAASLKLSHAQVGDYASLNFYSHSLQGENSTLDGCDTTQCDLEDGDDVSETNQFGNLAMYADRQNGNGNCWGDSRYCSTEYLVEQGEINDGSGNLVEAFTVHPPTVIATQFVASKTKLMFKINSPTFENYTVFQFFDGENGKPATFLEVEEFTAVDGVFVTTDISVSGLSGSKTYFSVPSDNKPSIYPDPPSGTTTQKVHMFTQSLNKETQALLLAEMFDVSPASPFQPSAGWNQGPDQHNHKYGFRRTFTRALQFGGSTEGVIWQDQNDWKIYVTWIESTGHINVELPNPDGHYLVGAASDGGVNGEIIYMTFSRNGASDGVTPLDVVGRKVDSKGGLLQEVDYDTANNGGLNVYRYFSSGSSVYWDVGSNTLGWMVSRTMTRSNDGLNHQSCICVIVDTNTLEVLKNRGQTSSHSWNNYIVYNSKEERYLAVDLGDNFPRGVHVHNIPLEGSIKRKLAYTFKTKHGTSATSPAGTTYPVYEEISNSENTFYKWSNDNAVYTEIAHPPTFIKDDDSILVLFSGERPPLENGLASRNSNTPRNLGLVIVSGDLESIVSKGEDSKGGFYNFGGGWSDQSNEGIVWLTNFTPDETDNENFRNAIRIKTAAADKNIFIFYEVWGSNTYIESAMMMIDLDGNILVEPMTMPFDVRLSPTDEPIVTKDGDIVFYSTDETGSKLIRYSLTVGAPPTDAPTPAATLKPTAVKEGSGSKSPTDAPTTDAPINTDITATITEILASITALLAICTAMF